MPPPKKNSSGPCPNVWKVAVEFRVMLAFSAQSSTPWLNNENLNGLFEALRITPESFE